MSVDKLILGTAGLGGLPYGRNRRVVTFDEAVGVLERAYHKGIRSFDTAPAYGFAEKAIGKAITGSDCTIYTKTIGDIGELIESVRRLGQVPAVLWHNYKRGTGLNGWVSGFTAYSGDDWVDMQGFPVQTDWSILNQQRAPNIARSIFLQGVLAGEMPPSPELGEYVSRAQSFANGLGMPLKMLALHAALQIADKVVVGATSVEEVDEVVAYAGRTVPKLFPLIRVLDCPDRSLTDPRNWEAA